MQSNHSQPLVSVVTPSYNAADTIRETIESVLTQTYPAIEYIVIDGGSKDGTVDILRSYQDRLQFVSERDEGQSDAINKGWQRAKGDILAWLCADDLYLPQAVELAVETLSQNPATMWVYGLNRHIDKLGNPYPFRNPTLQWDYQALLQYGNYIIQPTVFMRREVPDTIGFLHNDLYYTMDYEYWLRIGQKHAPILIPHEMAVVRYSPDVKTIRGGDDRLTEIEQVVSTYGGYELPESFRHDWTRIHLSAALQNMVRGKWAAGKQSIQKANRYPNHLPRAMAKMLLNVLPHSVELQLRQRLLKKYS